MKNLLNSKQSLILNKLISKLTIIKKRMQNEGISSKDINIFFMANIFKIQTNKVKVPTKLSKDLNSQTQEQTNSQSSQSRKQTFQIELENAISKKIQNSQKIDKILLQYVRNCCVEQSKFLNYLAEEQNNKHTRIEVFDFDRVKLPTTNKKYLKNTNKSIQDYLIPKNQPQLSHLCSIKERILQQKKSQIQESQKQLDYIRSFERTLSQSIRKTKMLRSMLEKRIVSGFSINNQDQSQLNFDNEEIY